MYTYMTISVKALRYCSMKTAQGLREKAEEFRKAGGEIYRRA